MPLKRIIIIFLILIPFILTAQTDEEPSPSEIKELVNETLEGLNETTTDSEELLIEEVSEIEEEVSVIVDEPELMEDQSPEWVRHYANGEIGKISQGSDSYFGVGSSDKNQGDADSNARLEFARNVETRVESSYEEITSIKQGDQDYSLEMNTQVKTNLSLKGVNITEVWSDGETFYSLIRMPREEYTTLLERNITEELALQASILAKERADLEAEAERKRLADLEDQNRQEEEARRLEEERRKIVLREQRLENQRMKYRKFLEMPPAPALISFRNGQLNPRFQRYSLTTGIVPGISPFDPGKLLQKLEFGYTFFQFLEIYSATTFINQDGSFGLGSEELTFKIRFLNNMGDIFKFSVGAGGKILIHDLSSLNIDTATFFASGVISFPMVLYSHLSVYAGLDRIGLGITTHPLYFLIGDAVSLIGEANFIIPDGIRKITYPDGWLFQGGLRFKTSDVLTMTLEYRDNALISLTTELTL